MFGCKLRNVVQEGKSLTGNGRGLRNRKRGESWTRVVEEAGRSFNIGTEWLPPGRLFN